MASDGGSDPAEDESKLFAATESLVRGAGAVPRCVSRLPLCFVYRGGRFTPFTVLSQCCKRQHVLVMGFGRGFGRCPGDAPGELPQKYKMAITFVTMSITTIIGFRYQQHLIRQRFSDEDLEMYIKVRQIRERELEAIAAMERADTRPSR